MNLEQLRARREQILATARRHGARTLRVFGSVARGDADVESDVDFLVELEPGRSLLDQGALLMDLQEQLGCRVDVMTEAGLRPSMRARALQEAIAL
jgi:predicted nucleotidyltransferase